MKIGNLETGKELTPEELTDWLIQRTRFLMGRKIPKRTPKKFQEEVKEFNSKINAYKTEEQKLIDRMKEQLDLMLKQMKIRDGNIEDLKKQLNNAFRMLDTVESNLGEERQENNELRKRLSPVTGNLGQ